MTNEPEKQDTQTGGQSEELISNALLGLMRKNLSIEAEECSNMASEWLEISIKWGSTTISKTKTMERSYD